MMTRVVKLLFISFFFLSGQIYAGESFDKANVLYGEGKYVEALDSYKKISKTITSSNLFYNMGNCYYLLDSLPQAIYYFEKALKYDPTNKEILENLELANAKKIDSFKGENYTPKLAHKLLLVLPHGSWAIIAFIFSFIASGLFIVYLFSKKKKVKVISFYIGVVVVVVSILSIVLNQYQKAILLNCKSAIVFENNSKVVNSPNQLGEELFILHEGTKLFVKDSSGIFFKVQTPNRLKGWIKKEAVKLY